MNSPIIRLHATESGVVLERDGRFVRAGDAFSIDALFASDDPGALAAATFARGAPAQRWPVAGAGGPGTDAPARSPGASGPGYRSAESLRAPIQSQEVWAAGVTYLRSKTARIEESKVAGGGSFYDRVYEAERPELFFKATPHRVAAHGTPVRIRGDSKWNVPEPELTLAINAHGRIFGYTIGNDMSSRDIEGENPLYLPQAKVYDRSAALGPCLVIASDPPASETKIAIEIRRAGANVFSGETSVGRIKRPLPSLAEWLFRENSFPHGCYLMTGTGVVPPDSFTLQRGDEIRITLEPVGTLINVVADEVQN